MPLYLILLLLFAANSAYAENYADSNSVKNALDDSIPLSSISDTEFSNLYYANASQNKRITILDNNGSLVFFTGAAYKIVDGNIVNLTKQMEEALVVRELKAVPSENIIAYSPRADVEHTLYVFTDISCHYCILFHGTHFLDNSL